MPFRRRPVRPVRPLAVALPAPVNLPPRFSAFDPTALPTSVIPVTAPRKLPPRPVSGHPLGTILTVPTVGPLPSVVRTVVLPVANDPTIVPPPRVAPRRPPVGLPPALLRRPQIRAPFVPGIPVGRPPFGRVPVLRR